jgi:fructan beta-fructosidase
MASMPALLLFAVSARAGHIPNSLAVLSHVSSPMEASQQVPLYREPLRPQFHFTARQWADYRLNPVEHQEGWINDLNGLIYYDGEYHLFAQRWATCWLHAVSRDLIHWKELHPAFWEESPGSGVQSGTCVIDYHNTSGLSPNPSNPPMVAFWSKFDNLSQCLCYSLDHGRTWTHYAKNPIMEHPERDPKVFWYAPGKHWVMVMYGEGRYHVLTSANLLDWKDEHNPIENSFECPDFFELPVDGNPKNKKWVLIQGNGNYSIGTFNGTKFTEETGRRACDIGPNFYATQSWANTDTGDGRRIQVAWMRGAKFPDMPFNQEISFPCELTLYTTKDGLRIFRQPITEIRKLHNRESKWSNVTLAAGQDLSMATSGDLFQICADLSVPAGAKLTFNLRGVSVAVTDRTLDSASESAATQDGVRHVEILLDRGSLETFINHGEISDTRFVLPNSEGLSLRADGGAVKIDKLSVYSLHSAWTVPPTH